VILLEQLQLATALLVSIGQALLALHALLDAMPALMQQLAQPALLNIT
jgi:hypothetical protein